MKKILIGVLVIMANRMTAADNQARAILEKSVATTASLKGCSYIMKGYERQKGKLFVIEVLTKVNVSPAKIYTKVLADPNKGTELLYVKGERGDKIRVNPGKFLPTLSMSPFNSMLTKDQHHTLLSSGFNLYTRLIRDAIKRADEQKRFDDVCKFDGEVTFNGRKCYKITLTDPTFSYTTVTGKPGESLYTLNQRLLVPECLIVELNPFVKNFETDLSGKQVKVPTAYAKTSTIYIDKETNMPLYQEMSDEKAVFERYEYSNLKANPAFKDDEFTEKFPEYSF